MPTVRVERSIEIGNRFCISPSQLLREVQDGVIEVIDLCEYDKLLKEDTRVQTLVTSKPNWVTANWVVYGYVDSLVDDQWYPMPLKLFAEHISHV